MADRAQWVQCPACGYRTLAAEDDDVHCPHECERSDVATVVQMELGPHDAERWTDDDGIVALFPEDSGPIRAADFDETGEWHAPSDDA